MMHIALLLLFVGGFLLITRISPRFSLTERIGFAFPVGLGAVTFLMMLQDWMGIGLTRQSCLVLTLLVAVMGAALLVPRRREVLEGLTPRMDFSWFNLLWLLLLVVLVYVEYGNWLKCMYFPVYDRDSMAGFDTIGYIAAQEHTYRGMSIFGGDYMPKLHQAGSCISYLPMLQLAYAYVYAFGADTSKVIPGLFYLSFIVGFYGLCCRATNRTAAMLATLATVFTPEMLSFSSLSITNVVQGAMASTGLLYVALWFQKGERRDLILGAVLIAVNNWLRAEGIIFGGVAGLLVLVQCCRRKASWWALAAPVATLLPTVVFSAYAAANQLTSESAVIARLYWDGEKAAQIWGGAWSLLRNMQYYGWTWLAVLLAFAANIYYTVRRRDNVSVLAALVLSIALYYVVLYHVDYKWDSIGNVLAYSAKRYMFCYVPIAWYYVCTCRIVQRGMGWIEDTCGLRTK